MQICLVSKSMTIAIINVPGHHLLPEYVEVPRMSRDELGVTIRTTFKRLDNNFFVEVDKDGI